MGKSEMIRNFSREDVDLKPRWIDGSIDAEQANSRDRYYYQGARRIPHQLLYPRHAPGRQNLIVKRDTNLALLESTAASQGAFNATASKMAMDGNSGVMRGPSTGADA